jgi:acetolactate decarboxylase
MKSIKITVYLAALFTLSLTAFSVLAAAPDNNKQQNTVFQVATIGSLAQGVYDGDYDYGQLKKHGNFGVGTFLDLDGEMVAIDGHFYQIEASGKLRTVSDSQIVPFAEVTDFRPTISKNLAIIASYQNLGDGLLKLFPNKNIPYAIRIDGTFKTLKLRSLRKQHKPYPTLEQAAKDQAIFNLSNVKGSMVGFWFPKYWAGIAVPGFHLHFVTDDRTIGGHVLEEFLEKGQLRVASIGQMNVYFPKTNSFAQANLSGKGLHSAINKAEGGHH